MNYVNGVVLIVFIREEQQREESLKSQQTEDRAPDGGYGWFVVAGQFIIMGLYGGFLKSLTVFFIPLRDAFK